MIHLGLVACGDHLETAVMVVKSAVLLTRTKIQAHIFAETDLQPKFESEVHKKYSEFKRFTIIIYRCILII